MHQERWRGCIEAGAASATTPILDSNPNSNEDNVAKTDPTACTSCWPPSPTQPAVPTHAAWPCARGFKICAGWPPRAPSECIAASTTAARRRQPPAPPAELQGLAACDAQGNHWTCRLQRNGLRHHARSTVHDIPAQQQRPDKEAGRASSLHFAPTTHTHTPPPDTHNTHHQPGLAAPGRALVCHRKSQPPAFNGSNRLLMQPDGQPARACVTHCSKLRCLRSGSWVCRPCGYLPATGTAQPQARLQRNRASPSRPRPPCRPTRCLALRCQAGGHDQPCCAEATCEQQALAELQNTPALPLAAAWCKPADVCSPRLLCPPTHPQHRVWCWAAHHAEKALAWGLAQVGAPAPPAPQKPLLSWPPPAPWWVAACTWPRSRGSTPLP